MTKPLTCPNPEHQHTAVLYDATPRSSVPFDAIQHTMVLPICSPIWVPEVVTGDHRLYTARRRAPGREADPSLSPAARLKPAGRQTKIQCAVSRVWIDTGL